MHNCVQTTSECWVRCDGCAPRVKRTVSFYFHLLVRMFEWLFSSSSSSASSLRPSEIIAGYFLGWLKSGICSEPKRSGRIEFPHVSARNIWTSLLFSRNFHCRAAVSPFVMAIWTLLDRIFTIHTHSHRHTQIFNWTLTCVRLRMTRRWRFCTENYTNMLIFFLLFFIFNQIGVWNRSIWLAFIASLKITLGEKLLAILRGHFSRVASWVISIKWFLWQSTRSEQWRSRVQRTIAVS